MMPDLVSHYHPDIAFSCDRFLTIFTVTGYAGEHERLQIQILLRSVSSP